MQGIIGRRHSPPSTQLQSIITNDRVSGHPSGIAHVNSSKHPQILIEKLQSHNATIGIVGLGYVGLPLALRCAEVFNCVIGFDTDPEKIRVIDTGRSYIKQIDHSRVEGAIGKGFKASGDFTLAAECDALIICVPTPLTKHQEPDLSFVRITTESLLPYLRPEQVLVLESTTFPGTTEELIVPRVEKVGRTIGKDFYVVYSPEREDPGNPNYSTQTIPKIVGGHTAECLAVGTALYQQIIDVVVPVSSTKVAEMAKLLENIHRAVNIGLVNEMKIVADKMGINIHEVIKAAATKPFGFVAYTPGPGLGGHCIPIDPFYLTWKAKEYGVNTRFIELAGEINNYMPHWVVQKVSDALNERGKAVKGSRILILGIAYKKNIDDSRESPAIEIMALLQEKGAHIEYSDPHVPKFPRKRDYHFDLSSVALNEETIKGFDCVVLATDHDAFDYDLLNKSAILIVDTRGRLSEGSHVIAA